MQKYLQDFQKKFCYTYSLLEFVMPCLCNFFPYKFTLPATQFPNPQPHPHPHPHPHTVNPLQFQLNPTNPPPPPQFNPHFTATPSLTPKPPPPVNSTGSFSFPPHLQIFSCKFVDHIVRLL